MSWIRQKYGDINIMILENGFSKSSSGLNDVDRIDYIGKYLEQVKILFASNAFFYIVPIDFSYEKKSLEIYYFFKNIYSS